MDDDFQLYDAIEDHGNDFEEDEVIINEEELQIYERSDNSNSNQLWVAVIGTIAILAFCALVFWLVSQS